MLVAAGLDPERCILFRQGDVPEHTELSWLLSGVTALGELNRMHQFRDKSAAQRELVVGRAAVLPVLLAADVLAYRAHEVPVGEDQREHLELMRDVAERFNERFGETLVVPEGTIPTVGARVRDLQEPERKMSTTGGTAKGTVYVLDEPAAIGKKFKRAVTDSGREVVRGDGQARRHEPDRDPRRRARHRARRRSSASSPAGLRRLQERGRRGGRRLARAGARALRGAARGRGGARGDPGGRRGEGAARSPAATVADVRAAMGVAGPVRRPRA